MINSGNNLYLTVLEIHNFKAILFEFFVCKIRNFLIINN